MEDKGARSAATAFTIAIHAALAVALVLSVAWKSKEKPQVSELSAELFSKSSPAPAVEKSEPPPPPPPPLEKVEPPPPSAQKVEAAPAPAEIKAGPSAAEIALKEKEKREEVEKKKVEAERAEKAKLEAERKQRDAQSRLALQKQADRDANLRALQAEANVDDKSAERAAKEQARAREEASKLAASRAADAEKAAMERNAKNEAQAQAQKAAQEKAARDRGLADYVAKIRNKVRGNIVYAQEISGNPEAIFEITQLPSGDVTRVQLRKSSGSKPLDDAIERAIQKSSPLPKPENSELFQRVLILQVKPNE
jgi:colicin import membrane protein